MSLCNVCQVQNWRFHRGHMEKESGIIAMELRVALGHEWSICLPKLPMRCLVGVVCQWSRTKHVFLVKRELSWDWPMVKKNIPSGCITQYNQCSEWLCPYWFELTTVYRFYLLGSSRCSLFRVLYLWYQMFNFCMA